VNKVYILDEELISHYCRDGSKEAFAQLFERYQHLGIAASYKYLQDKDLARDACMQVFEKLLTTICSYKIDFFKAWFHTVLKNHCLMGLRKKKAPITYQENIDQYDVESGEELHLAIKKENHLNLMHECLQQLEPKQRNCMQLFYLEEKSYNQIIALTGMNYMEVKSAIQNGKRNLKILMNKKFG
jgi:RNA polymerase sigma factor (sigma-70 family)